MTVSNLLVLLAPFGLARKKIMIFPLFRNLFYRYRINFRMNFMMSYESDSHRERVESRLNYYIFRSSFLSDTVEDCNNAPVNKKNLSMQ